MISCVDTGLVYRNPAPHLRSVHAWHPSLVRLDNGELIASFDLGEAVEALNYRTYLARSIDDGQTWSAPVRILEDWGLRRATHTIRLSRTVDGTLLGFGGRHFRDNPDEGLVRRDNLGFVPMELFSISSRNQGRTWTVPRSVRPSLVGPAFEMCHSIVELPDGRWLAPTSTWKGWDGEAPNGMQCVALVSHDRGQTWPEYLRIMDGYQQGIIYWEVSLARLLDGRLLAVCWVFDERSGKSRPNEFALSSDGQTFSSPWPTGTNGQTAKFLVLHDGRILCLYRREDQPGLWAELAQIEGDRWVRLAELPVWQGAAAGMTGQSSAGHELAALKFGYPTLVQLANGDVLVAFWCLENCVHNIRWTRLRVG